MDEWTEEDVGTVLPCGCEVDHFNFECFRHDYPQTDCEDCAFGVPVIGRELIEALMNKPPPPGSRLVPLFVPGVLVGLERPCGCGSDVRVFGHTLCPGTPPRREIVVGPQSCGRDWPAGAGPPARPPRDRSAWRQPLPGRRALIQPPAGEHHLSVNRGDRIT